MKTEKLDGAGKREEERKKDLCKHLEVTAQNEGEGRRGGPVVKQKSGDMFREFMMRHEKDFEMVVPRHMSPERVMRLGIAACKRQPKLLNCWMPSVVGGLLEASSLGLEVNGPMGEASLIPFKNNTTRREEAELIIEYKGYIKLFLNHPAAVTIFARPVFKKDVFDYEYGSNEFIKHVPCTSGDRGEVKGFYAYAKLKDGGFRFVFMYKFEVDHIRDTYSPSWKSDPTNSAWREEKKGGSYLKMGCKTAVRELQTFLPKASELGRAAEADFKVIDPFDAANFRVEEEEVEDKK